MRSAYGPYSTMALLTVFLFLNTLATTPVHAQQNVVFIILDACRADCVDASREGVPLMPFLSTFPSMKFSNVRSASSWTKPSMASVFTSTHVDTHQAHTGVNGLPESTETMAQYLKSAGYATFAVQTNGFVTGQYGFSKGFDTFVFGKDHSAEWTTDQALSLVSGTAGPFFLYVHYNQPHVPYFPPPPYQAMMGHPHPALVPVERAIVEDFNPYQRDFNMFHRGLISERAYAPLSSIGREAARTLYDGEVRYTDDQLRLLLNALLAEHPDTIVIVTADHGEHFFEHNALGHVTTVYEEVLRVPFLLRAPEAGATSVGAPFSLVDVLPTLAGLLALPGRPWWEGRDMLDPEPESVPVFATSKGMSPWFFEIHAVCDGASKLIWNCHTGEVELYDLDADPQEQTNLADVSPETCRRLMNLLHRHLLANTRVDGVASSITAVPGGLVEEGRNMQLVANPAEGHLWFKDGAPLDEATPGLEGVHTNRLHISNLNLSDSGVYECLYSDDMARLRVTAPFHLRVQAANTVPLSSMSALLALAAALTAVVGVRFSVHRGDAGHTR